jgi:5'-3' exonuclease
MKSMSTLAIIDADSIIYAAAFAAQDWAVFDDDGRLCNIYVSKAEAKEAAIHAGDSVEPFPLSYTEARENADTIINGVIADLEPDQVEIWLTHHDSSANFRKAVDPTYKDNRRNFVKPFHFPTVREHLIENWDANIGREGWEADDEVAAIGWQNFENEKDTVYICSIDKDLDTVPGWHYRWQTYNRDAKKYYLSNSDAMFNYWVSVLTGDNADNIPGLHRVGPKTAEKIVSECDTPAECYKACLDKYFEVLGKEDMTTEEIKNRMHTNCEMLYLLRHDNDKWEPPEV